MMKTTLEQVTELAAQGLTVTDIAKQAGVSRGWVYALADRHNIPLASRMGPPVLAKPDPKIRQPVLTGGVNVPMNSTITGTVSELLVAADLLSRGWQPYMPLVRNRGHDLVACQNETVVTIEVRSAKRNKDGHLIFGRSYNDNSDHYALVTTGEQVTYRPELPKP